MTKEKMIKDIIDEKYSDITMISLHEYLPEAYDYLQNKYTDTFNDTEDIMIIWNTIEDMSSSVKPNILSLEDELRDFVIRFYN